MARTARDERDYLATLKREDPIQREIIIELREQNKRLWATQAWLLRTLIAAEDNLRVYRVVALELAEFAMKSDSRCVPSCQRHVWQDEDGWHKREVPNGR